MFPSKGKLQVKKNLIALKTTELNQISSKTVQVRKLRKEKIPSNIQVLP